MGGQARLMCISVIFAPNGLGRLIARLAAAAAHTLLALWLHYSLDLACWLIDKNEYIRLKNSSSRDFINCIDVIFGTNILQTAFHFVAALEELISGFVSLCAVHWRGNSIVSKRTTYKDADG